MLYYMLSFFFCVMCLFCFVGVLFFKFVCVFFFFFFFSSRRRHTRCLSDWSSDVCSSDLLTCCVKRAPSAGAVSACTGWARRPLHAAGQSGTRSGLAAAGRSSPG